MAIRFIVIVSLMGVSAGLLVVLAASPVRAALGLVTAFVCMSAVMVAVGADFIGFKCIIVYAGAIIVVFIFVLMLLNLEWGVVPRGVGDPPRGPRARAPLGVGAPIALALGHALSQKLASSGHFDKIAGPIGAWCRTSAECIGDALYGWSIFWFITGGLVLLAALMGAVILNRPARGAQEGGHRRQDMVKQTGRKKRLL